MLQITIVHCNNNTKIQEVIDHDLHDVIATFDKDKGYIDLGPLTKYIGKDIIISHYNIKDNTMTFDYEQSKVLTKVDRDSDNMWFIEYE